MKLKINIPTRLLKASLCLVCCLLLHQVTLRAQDTTAAAKADVPAKVKPVKNTFQSVWIIDNQTVMVPVKGTFEMDIQHRFGTVNNGYSDFWGLFASSNIRIGVGYAPINNLNLGIGIDKFDMLWDGSAKYAIMKQTKGKFPVSITYYGDLAIDTRKDVGNTLFAHQSDRFISFNQIIIARKINDKLSLQVAPSITHQNAVQGFYTKNDSTGQSIFEEMKHDHFAIAVSGRYKLGDATAVLVNYDQPLTHHATNNPSPNLSFGFEFATSGHTFQLFMGNYSMLNPGKNNLYNTNSPFKYTQSDGTKMKGGQFVIGFNITRLWN
ncbi:hypothetical protein KXD93_12865 [Mucilaginibacter sp. BJC16-A38]|uniref:DUF5777 family beta-barrel protein n=1 Tax=Mucilaginibacter phenanthrenivorans TaxID=1234842 RepID=UPI0021585B4B|nr:DUF5777 family beta-barrel protein [Mucilaginibacter phenanthrenivorans]MCR8558540.1 hypothetical protein [Mucilaginibacter phenanthrenivorans]